MPCEASTTRMPAKGLSSVSGMFRHRDPVQRVANVAAAPGAMHRATRIPDEYVASAQAMAETFFRSLVQKFDVAVVRRSLECVKRIYHALRTIADTLRNQDFGLARVAQLRGLGGLGCTEAAGKGREPGSVQRLAADCEYGVVRQCAMDAVEFAVVQSRKIDPADCSTESRRRSGNVEHRQACGASPARAGR